MTIIDDLFASLPPEPKFDRLAVRDLRPFESLPRARNGNALLGIPVVVDESVEPGVVELRNRGDVVGRVVIFTEAAIRVSELRAAAERAMAGDASYEEVLALVDLLGPQTVVALVELAEAANETEQRNSLTTPYRLTAALAPFVFDDETSGATARLPSTDPTKGETDG